jgi:hypothetical protein
MPNDTSPRSIEQKIAEMQESRRRTPQQVIRANSDFRRKQSLAEIEDILKAHSKDVPYGTPKQLAAFVDLYRCVSAHLTHPLFLMINRSTRAENERLEDENTILKAELSRLAYRS